jgi:dipicolinate synthase subunit A
MSSINENIKSDIKIGVIGGDLRQLVAAQELAGDGYETAVYGFDEYSGSFGMTTRCVNLGDALRKADFIVLPLPYSLDGIHLNTPLSQCEIHLDEFFGHAEPQQIFLAGRTGGHDIPGLSSKNIKVIDYYQREYLSVLNALPTDRNVGGYAKSVGKTGLFKVLYGHAS